MEGNQLKEIKENINQQPILLLVSNFFLLQIILFLKAYFVLDELILGGEIQETSKNAVLKAISQQDVVQEVTVFMYLRLGLSKTATFSSLAHWVYLLC